MSDDIANLGFRVDSSPLDQANQKLDQLPAKAGAAQKATDALGTSSAKASDALLKSVLAIQAQTAELVKLQQAQALAAQGAQAQVQAVTASAAATQRVTSFTMQYSASLGAVTQAQNLSATAAKAQAAAAQTASAQTEAAISKTREMAEAIQAQNQAFTAGASGAGGGQAAVQARSNAAAILELNKATSVDAEQTRLAAIAHANVNSIMGAGTKVAKDAAAGHQQLSGALGLTSFQLRQIAIQTPDVVQGLLSGQRPLQVLIQQGGQVAQILGMGPGGFGGALRAVVGFLPGLLGFGAAAAVVGTLAAAFVKGRQAAADLANALAVTNGYAGVTASNFEGMAQRITTASNTGIGQAKAVILQLVSTGQYTGQTLTNIAAYSTKFAELTGEDASKVAGSFSGMKDNVTSFAVAHAKAYHDISQAQVDQIAQLQAAGKLDEAAAVASKAINDAIQKNVVQYGFLGKALHDAKVAADDFWNSLLGLGKPQTLQQQLESAEQSLREFRAANGNGVSTITIPGVGEVQAKVPTATTSAAEGNVANLVDQMAKASFEQSKQQITGNVGDPLAAQAQQSAQTAAINSALSAQAQALAGLTVDISKRATLEKQALTYQDAAARASLAQQIVEVNSNANLNAAQKSAITGMMSRAAAINSAATAERKQLIDAQTHDALIQQANTIADAQTDAETATLQLQRDLATGIEARRAIDLKLQYLADQKVVADAQAVIDSKLSSDADKARAKITLDHLPDVHALQQQIIDQQALVAAIHMRASLAQDDLQNAVSILASQAELVNFAADRIPIDKQILGLQQQIAISKAQEAIDAATAANDQAALTKAQADLVALLKIQANQRKAQNGTLSGNYQAASDALQNVATDIGQHDFAKAATDLINAFKSVSSVLNDSSATLEQKLGSLAGAAAGIGNLIGGQAGKTINAAGQGFQIGNTLLGPIGGVLGAIGGTISSLIGDGGKARRDQEDQANQAALTLAQTAAQQRQQQEIDLANAAGDTLAATNIQRQQELNSLDASNRARQQEIYDLQDEMTALQKTLDTATDAVTKAQSDLQTAYQAQVTTLNAVVQAAQQASDSLGTFLRTLQTGDLSANTPGVATSTARSALVGINDQIAGGDQSALGNIQDAVSTFLTASKASSSTLLQYKRDAAFAQQSVMDARKAAESQVSVAQQQLDTLNVQVGALLTVNNSVLTVAAAVANLQAAMAAQTTAQQALDAAKASASANDNSAPGYTSTNGDFAKYVEMSPDLLAAFKAQVGYARGRTEAAFGQIQWTTSGQYENRAVRPYALGGAFTNGVVDTPTYFNNSVMGEAGPEAIMPLHRGSDGSLGVRAANDQGWSEVVDELQALREEVRGFRSEAKTSQGFLKTISDLFIDVTRGGKSVIVTDEAA